MPASASSPRRTVRLPVSESVRWITRRLEGEGFETWAVGGAVRDALAGVPIGDWDLATAARPADMRRVFRRTVPVGIEHGTVGVLDRQGTMFEVTTFRRDVETDGRHARVSFSDTIEEDLSRRDFTINAVAWHPLREELLDPFAGADDLRSGVLRTVGDPDERFREDYLRILRCFRFAGRFDLEVDQDVWDAAQARVESLLRLSAERIREELYKSLGFRRGAAHVLDLYRRSGALRVLYPEVADRLSARPEGPGGARWSRMLRTVEAVPSGALQVRIAALLHDPDAPQGGEDAAKDASAVMTRLRTSNAERDRVIHLVALAGTVPVADVPGAEVRRWLHRVGRRYVNDLLRLHAGRSRAGKGSEPDAVREILRIRAELRRRPPLETADLAIGGGELRALGLRPGPRYGEILGALLDRVLEEPALNTKERLIAIVERDWIQNAR